MRGAWTIALREIGERRALLLAALVAGLFPFASPLLPGVRAGNWAEARDIGALVVSVSFGIGCALLLGATIIGRDLAERRLSFDFARPVGSGGIWAGRLGGALGLSVLALGVALFPATVVGGGLLSASVGQDVRGVALAAVAGTLVLIPLAHVAGVALRSRSGWLVIDLAAAGVVALLLGGLGRLLYDAFALQLLAYTAIVLGILAVPAVWAASVVQVVVGRTDPRRGHAAQTCTLWGILLSLGLLSAVFVGWVFAASPRDLRWIVAEGAPRGSWVAVTGEARGRGDYAPLFLLDAASGRHIKVGTYPSVMHLPPPIMFSSDGRRAIVFHVEGPRDLRTQVSIVDLDDPAGRMRDTNIVFSSPWSSIALSDDGTRLATLSEGTLSVTDLNTGANLAAVGSIAPGHKGSVRLFFVSPDCVRAVAAGEHSSIDELRVSTHTVERHRDIAEWNEEMTLVEWDATHDRYLIQAWGRSNSALLTDGRSGARIRELTCPDQDCRWRLLTDGRIVRRDTALRLLSADGDELAIIQPPSAGRAFFMRELVPGQLVVRVDPDEHPRSVKGGKEYVLDIATGSWTALPEDLDPVTRSGSWGRAAAESGSVAAHLFRSGGTLVLYDPATGSRRVIAGRE